MSTLKGLPNAYENETPAILIRDTNHIDCILNLNSAYACIAADNNGSFHFWVDTDSYYRGELMRHYKTIDKIKTYNFNELIEKAEKWFEEIK